MIVDKLAVELAASASTELRIDTYAYVSIRYWLD